MELKVVILSTKISTKKQGFIIKARGLCYRAVSIVSRVEDLLSVVFKFSPNVVIIDEEIMGEFGTVKLAQFLKQMQKLEIVIISSKTTHADNNLIYVNSKIGVLGLIRQLNKIFSAPSLNNSNANMNIIKQINDELLVYNFSSSLLGFNYIIDAIEETILKKCHIKNIEDEIYNKIATKYSVSIDSVERNIRHAIKIAKDECHILNADNLFKENYDLRYGGNKRFILRIANKIVNSNRY
ncbi:MAG: hypothetical protein IJT25_01775 [Clostridia bacterium]|nr:hypothetical protein [Clostridia bacterium]